MRSLLLFAALLSSSAAFAKGEGGGIRDTSYHRRPFQLSLFAMVPYEPYYGLGAGLAVRFAIPLVHQGFIPSINDSFELELGSNFYSGLYAHYYVFTPVVEARWTFHITSKFSAYGKVGFGWSFPFDHPTLRPQVYVGLAGGILFEVVDWFYLRAEVGYPGLLLGVAFAF